MAEIDRKLERLMGQEEYNAILNAPSSITFDTVCHKTESEKKIRLVMEIAVKSKLVWYPNL